MDCVECEPNKNLNKSNSFIFGIFNCVAPDVYVQELEIQFPQYLKNFNIYLLISLSYISDCYNACCAVIYINLYQVIPSVCIDCCSWLLRGLWWMWWDIGGLRTLYVTASVKRRGCGTTVSSGCPYTAPLPNDPKLSIPTWITGSTVSVLKKRKQESRR